MSAVSDPSDVKADLVEALERLDRAILEKLDGLTEYDLRRPLTPTGSNMLGIVKHLASVQAGYFGDVFGRPWPEPMPWMGPGAEVNADMYATADETSDGVRDFARRAWDHALETFALTPLDAVGTVPWWPDDRRHPTLAAVLVHVLAETARHAGHLDVLRELVDGTAGRFAGDPSFPGDVDWLAHVARVEDAARSAAD